MSLTFKSFLPALLFCFCNLIFAGQKSEIDSLLKLFKKDKEDTNKVIHAYKLCGRYEHVGKYDSALYYGNSGLQLAEKLNYKRGARSCLGNMGVVHDRNGNYLQALDHFFAALKIEEELQDKNGKAKRFASIGIVYNHQGNYPKALEYNLKALKINEETADNKAEATTLGNIGLVYWKQENYEKALDYYFKALKMNEALENKIGLSFNLGNIGIIYYAQKKYEMALDYYLKAQKLYEELDLKRDIAINFGNIANIYKAQGVLHSNSPVKRDSLFKMAMAFYLKSLKIAEAYEYNEGIALQLGNIGSLLNSQNKVTESCTYFMRGIALASKIGSIENVATHYEMLSILYENSNVPLPDSTGGKLLNREQMRLKALYYFKRYLSIRDTLFSEENKKQLVRKEMNFDFEKKEAAAKAEQNKKDAISKEELKQKEQQRNYFIAGFGMLAILSLFILRGYRQKQKVNIVITEQKALVDEKQKEILDSIHYAQRIQRALLPSEKYFDKTLARLNRNK